MNTMGEHIPGPKILFLMTHLFEDDTLNDIINELPNLKSLGINIICIRSSGVDVSLLIDKQHSVKTFDLLLEKAHTFNIKICLDITLNYLNSNDKYRTNGPYIHRANTEFLLSTTQFERDLWKEIDQNSADSIVVKSQDKFLSSSFVSSIQNYVCHVLINNYQKLIDYTSELSPIDTHTKIQEFSSYNAKILDRFIKHILENVSSSTRKMMFWLDFPLMCEIHQLNNSIYSFHSLANFIVERQNNHYTTRNLFPILEHRDFQQPNRTNYLTLLSYMLSEFISLNPTVIHNDRKQFHLQNTCQSLIDSISSNNNIEQLTNKLTKIFRDYRLCAGNILIKNVSNETLVIQRNLDIDIGRSIVLAINKSSHQTCLLFNCFAANSDRMLIHIVEKQVKIQANNMKNQLHMHLPASSFILFEGYVNVKGLFSLLLSKSPLNSIVSILIDNPITIDRLSYQQKQDLKPELGGMTYLMKKLTLRIISLEKFLNIHKSLTNCGYWILFTPSGVSPFPNTVQCGHFLWLVNGVLYSRNLDCDDSLTTQSIDDIMHPGHISNMLRKTFIIGQFFETDADALVILENYLNIRCSQIEIPIKYLFRSLSTQRKHPTIVENCCTFQFPWVDQRMIDMFPTLEKVRHQLGSMSVAELPNFQLSLNIDSMAYRGTLLITSEIQRFQHELLANGMMDDKEGQELLYSGPLEFIF